VLGNNVEIRVSASNKSEKFTASFIGAQENGVEFRKKTSQV